MFTGVPGGGGVLEHAAHGKLGEQFPLDAREDLGEFKLSGVRFAKHVVPSQGYTDGKGTGAI
jgi:hypothetical protein